MKRSLYILLFLYSSAFAQEEYISIGFSELIQKPCPFDSTIITSQVDGWMIYQTLDSTWNGEIDSSICINVIDTSFYIGVKLSEVDRTKPLFVRRILNDSTKPLLFPDYLYQTYGNFRVSDTSNLKWGVDCPNNLCSGLIVGIDIPNETGDGRNSRYYQIASENDWTSYAEACIPTEKFEDNYLGDFVFKFVFNENSSEGETILLFGGGMEMNFYRGRIYDIALEERYKFNDRYQVYVGELSADEIAWGSYMLMYDRANDYPSFQTPHYVEARPILNSDIVEKIDIDMGYETLIAQPFTNLRGALIEGSDSLRHEVNLINNGGDLCILFVELFFEGNTHYYHNGGNINMDGRTACMMFQWGGSMNVAPATELIYGNSTGDGAIAFGRDGQLNLGKHSEMIVNNRFVLMEKSRKENEQVYVDLQPGSKLIFGGSATLKKNTAFSDGKMKLNVYMNGGILDDSNLTEDEKQLINRIYPEEPEPLLEKISVYPNPAKDHIFIDIPMEAEGMIQVDLLDIHGKLVQTQELFADEGNHSIDLELKQGLSGVYLLRLSTSKKGDKKVFIEKVVLGK